MTDDKKLYTVQGNVQTVYDPQTIQAAKGGRKFSSEKTDVILQTPKGGKVRVTFWNQAVDKGIEGSDISITNLKYGGVYKETSQFSSTKESKIHVLNGAKTAQVATEVEEDPTDPGVAVTEPAVSEPEVDVEPVQEVATDPVPVEAPKKRGRPAKVEVPTQTTSTVATANPDVEQAHPSEALVLSNLQAAERISKAMGYERLSMEELIQLSDQVGRTAVALRIEQGKNGRMDRFQK
jgi:outer membrane biosynthesis protein TonB